MPEKKPTTDEVLVEVLSELRDLKKDKEEQEASDRPILKAIGRQLLTVFLTLLMAGGLGGGAVYFGGFGVDSESEEVDVLEMIRDDIDNKHDLRCLAAQYRVFSELVREDGERDTPFLQTSDQVYQKMRNIGFANVGPSWNLGEQYPLTVDLIEGFMREQGLNDDLQPLTPELRSAYCRACEYISGVAK